ncbi:hypothetical protein OS493_024247 [Desmophyllum pertusum]|uniref:Immunoglobulin subtype domain-containing protein n=1 Tax=Desmophyllum pertusum TaxID=174260 RepID=A0A9W9YY38_9CNID|nr:hypothetical protein OS493_024247 [Desmophyllum pertusum]
MILRLRSLANWWFAVVVISLSIAPQVESSSIVTITLFGSNVTKVLVNTPIIQLCWNYSVVGIDLLREVEFARSRQGADDYIGYADYPRNLTVVSINFPSRDRFSIKFPATLSIHNVTAADTGTYIFAVKLNSAHKTSSSVYLDVLGKL